MFSPKNQKAMHSSAFNPLVSSPTVTPAPHQVHDSSYERRSRSPAPATCIWPRSAAISNDLRIRRPWFTNGADVTRDKEPGTMRARQREQRERCSSKQEARRSWVGVRHAGPEASGKISACHQWGRRKYPSRYLSVSFDSLSKSLGKNTRQTIPSIITLS